MKGQEVEEIKEEEEEEEHWMAYKIAENLWGEMVTKQEYI